MFVWPLIVTNSPTRCAQIVVGIGPVDRAQHNLTNLAANDGASCLCRDSIVADLRLRAALFRPRGIRFSGPEGLVLGGHRNDPGNAGSISAVWYAFRRGAGSAIISSRAVLVIIAFLVLHLYRWARVVPELHDSGTSCRADLQWVEQLGRPLKDELLWRRVAPDALLRVATWRVRPAYHTAEIEPSVAVVRFGGHPD